MEPGGLDPIPEAPWGHLGRVTEAGGIRQTEQDMYIGGSIIPHDASEIRATISAQGNRWIELANLSVHIPDRPVLDALQAALDAIRADMDASEAPVAEPEAVA